MDRQHIRSHYTTRFVNDTIAGSAGVELLCEKSGETECVARVLYWDATGQFAFEAFKEIPLDIVEEIMPVEFRFAALLLTYGVLGFVGYKMATEPW